MKAMKRVPPIFLNGLMLLSVAFAAFAFGRFPPRQPPSLVSPQLAQAYEDEEMRMTIAGATLRLEGAIDRNAIVRFVENLDRDGVDIRTVSLDSPGGSLDAALAMAIVVRHRGLETRVPKDALCASSCPLLLAAGTTRQVEDGGLVGVHQISLEEEMLQSQAPPGRAGQYGVATGQMLVGVVAKHLRAMGVDPEIWLLSLDIPPSEIRLLTPEEMSLSGLTTSSR